MGDLSGRQRIALGLGLLAIVALVVALGWWAFRAPYGVLFSDLADQDAGAIVQELDKMKVPYQIGADGQAILVPEASVHKTRMTLMSRQLPLHGAVGFELFNNAEFGASDFVQKVNYQRALQGELTRTIASIEQVQSARVHLALPDPGLFRKDGAKAKASVTVVTKAGQTLSAAQVLGIQRLVGASVPDVRAEDVTVLDQRGVTLSRSNGDDGSTLAAGAHLDSKLELERHLTAKATQVLDHMFGKGMSLVTVDVVLNTQQIRVTTEEVLPAANLPKDQTPTGVVVRERTVNHDGPQDGSKATGPTSSSQEMDYATGKRTEQVVSPSGNVSRVNVAVVLKGVPPDQDLTRVKDLVAASVGAQSSRGDVVAVYSMAAAQEPEAAKSASLPAQPTSHANADVATAEAETSPQSRIRTIYIALLVAAFALAAAIVWRAAARRSLAAGSGGAYAKLSDGERQSVLDSVQAWLAAERRYEA